MAELGFRSVEEMIGQTHVLSQRDDVTHPKARRVDLSQVIADPGGSEARYKVREQRHEVDAQLDWELLERVEENLDTGEPIEIDAEISNVDRAVGATLSNKVSLRYAAEGLPDDTVTVNFEGAAGQSFGAFLAPGLTFRLSGVANDYFGKGLSGGKLIATTPDGARYDPTENTLVGNVALYGATGGEAYINGVAGERFAVRNSGVRAVVEGVGDHGCEYMTSGMVVVIGETGKNFAAGMSGGIAYVWDPDGEFADRANTDMVGLTRELEASDERAIRRLIENHAAHTGSDRAGELLDAWELVVDQFVKVMPEAYSEAIAERPEADARRSLPEPATAPSGARAPESAD